MAITIPAITRTDEQIQRDVLAELKWDARVQPNEVGVAVKNGIVTLTGWVDSYTKRWAAEEAARRVRGVKAVAKTSRFAGAASKQVQPVSSAQPRQQYSRSVLA